MAKVKVPTKKGPSKPPSLSGKPISPIGPKPKENNTGGPQGPSNQNQKAGEGATSPGNLGGMGAGGKGTSPAAAMPSSGQVAKKSITALLCVPEAVVMLPIAIFLDVVGMFFGILVFAYGIGIFLSVMLSLLGSLTIGTWAITRSFFRGVIEKAISDISSKATGGGEQQQKPSSSGGQAGKKAAKKGIKLSLSITRFIICAIIEAIPILGNIFPSYTIFVIWELIQGEV